MRAAVLLAIAIVSAGPERSGLRTCIPLLLPALACRPDLSVPAFAEISRERQLPYARQAFDLGRSHDEALIASFDHSYALTTGDLIDRAEIVTEFRRAVSIVRDRANFGDYSMTPQDLARAMEKFEGQVSFIAEARLHPLHTYPNAPPYDLYIETGPSTPPLAAKPLKRDPVYPPGAAPGSAITAVRLEGTFRRADIEAAPAPALVVTDDQANVIWKARIDLSRYR